MSNPSNSKRPPKLVTDFNGRWHQNRPFQHAINSGKDKAFRSMDEYEKACEKERNRILSIRKDKPTKHGERFNMSFEMAGAYQRVLPAIYIVGFIVLIAWALGTRQFAPDSRQTIDVFGTGKATKFVFLPQVFNGVEEIKTEIKSPFEKLIGPSLIASLIFAWRVMRRIGRRNQSRKIRTRAESQSGIGDKGEGANSS